MDVKKAIIMAAGLGTRLIPYSKEMPKEMLPLYFFDKGSVILKPVLQVIFEQLYDAGIREFCFIVGKNKRHVEDHFTPDWDFVDYLEDNNKSELAHLLKDFYEKIESSLIVWVNQPKPIGTGDAVYRAKKFVGDSVFMALAGDNLFLGRNIFMDILGIYDKYKENIMVVKEVEEPEKYGIIRYEKTQEEDILKVLDVIEKPKKPPSNLANVSIYVFHSEIFKFIENIEVSPRGEKEITDALRILAKRNNLYAYIARDIYWIDIGTPKTYLEALITSLNVILSKEEGDFVSLTKELLRKTLETSPLPGTHHSAQTTEDRTSEIK